MNDVLTIIFVEDDVNIIRAFTDYADTREDLKIVDICRTTTEAVTQICYLRPHAVILDLDIHKEDGSGLKVLKDVQDADLMYGPFFMIITNKLDDTFYDDARSLGAGYILYKQQGGYSEEYATNLLRLMGETIIAHYQRMQAIRQVAGQPHQRQSPTHSIRNGNSYESKES